MKRFLKKLIIFGILIIAICATLVSVTFCFASPQFTNEFTGAVSQKIERLKSINEPKIILVGNSNLTFGINSEMIEDAFNMPVVNLGGHGSFGLEFHLRMAKYNINKGDIVIVANTSYNNLNISDTELAWTTIENHNLWDLIPEDDYFKMLKSLPRYVSKTLFRWITGTGNKALKDTCYSREYFNEYGDNIYPRPVSEFTFKRKSRKYPILTDECATALNNFNNFCVQNGATCLVAGYPIAYGKYTAPEGYFIKFNNLLDEKLDCTVISDLTDYFIEYEYFYDTIYHLTDEGAKIRTEQLIEDIENWMQPQENKNLPMDNGTEG